jgi:ATP-binding cassette subfamily F protein 3
MEKIAPVLADAEFTFTFDEPGALPNPMLAMEDASFGYPPPADAPAGTPPTIIVEHVNRSVLAGQRIGILGANGQGKSTLVKTIAQTLAVQGGILTEGRGLTIGYFAQQELDVLTASATPMEHMIRLAKAAIASGKTQGRDMREQNLRTYLGTFNFSGDQVMQQVGTMSGGEKARLVLAMIVWQRPNLLLLDEPTNHLDLATREALAMALNEFEGTVMLVSHDRALLRSVCDSFWLVTRGGVSDFDGDLDDYQQFLLDEAKRQREEAAAPKVSAAQAAPKTKPASNRQKGLQRDLDKLDQHIQRLQKNKSDQEAALSGTTDASAIAEAGRKLQAIQEELDALEVRWLALAEDIEACKA